MLLSWLLSWSVSDDVRDPVVNGDSCLLELGRVRLRWSVELGAMTTVVTVADHAHLVELGTVL